MKNALDNSPLENRFTRIVHENKVRFIPQDIKTLQPSIALSVYESYLSMKHNSHNTIYDALQTLSYLITWGKHSNINIDSILLNGEILKQREINAFGAWLRQRGKLRSNKPIQPATVNKILDKSSQIFQWFASQYFTYSGLASERAVFIKTYKDSIKEQFADQRIKVRTKKSADDLTEEEIQKVEQFLKPSNRLKTHPRISVAQVHRDYLIWRIAIEFGLRGGEILALRLEDLPHRHDRHIKIVRIEERGSNYKDPREPYAPRPKTLSRELGFILKNSPIPKLITDYTTKFMRRKIVKHGRKILIPIIENPIFLIRSHKHDIGTPLSLSSFENIAATIRKETGIKHFHWHIVRHAFFNRAYLAIIDLKENDKEMFKDRLRDLVYWGGWESENSLQLYINRARHERAKTSLHFFQTEKTKWDALK